MAKQSIARIAEAEKAAERVEAEAKAEGERIMREAKAKAANIEKNAASDAKRGAAALSRQAANARDKAVRMVIDALVS